MNFAGDTDVRQALFIGCLPAKIVFHHTVFRGKYVKKRGFVMKMLYNVKDKPPFGKILVFAFQQLLAILAATIAVPAIIGNGMSQSAALFGAGVGTLIYLCFTKFKSPVFLGSSFAFIPSMFAAFAGGVSMSAGYFGLLIGAVLAGLVYVVIALVVKCVGVKWINKLMPAVVIGPTVAIIGLSLSSNAVANLVGLSSPIADGYTMDLHAWLCLLCGLATLLVTICCSVFAKKFFKTIPFIVGIVAGYILATVFTLIGRAFTDPALSAAFTIVDFSAFAHMQFVPQFTFLQILDGNLDFGDAGSVLTYIGTIAVAYVPVAFVVFAEHLADHKNISSIIEQDLLEDPGLSRTLLGDGVGSMVGAFFGGCPNTTYGESIGCVAISGNASVVTILTTAIIAIVAAFIAPFTTFLATIPVCVMGGVCVALYGFIAVSGLKMIQGVDLNDNRNLFVVSAVLIAGVGGLVLLIGKVKISAVACALILGILVNAIVHRKHGKEEK